jgi:hypothetical protein
MKDELYSEALEIIANSALIKPNDLNEALLNPTYNIFTKKKRSGGKRTIHEPLDKTLLVQNNLYYNFFAKVYTHNIIDSRCTGGIKGKSTKDNVLAHSFIALKFIAEVDIKDAFHCVTTESLKAALYDLFQIEVYYYRFIYYKFLQSKKNKKHKLQNGKSPQEIKKTKSEIHEWYKNEGRRTWQSQHDKSGFSIRDFFQEDKSRYIEDFIEFSKSRRALFPNKRNRLFRESVRDPLQFDYVSDLCICMADIVANAVTYKGILTQGPSTSPFMMALMVSYTNLLSQFNFDLPKRLFRHGFSPASFPEAYKGKSIYVDNISLSIIDDLNKKVVRNIVEAQLSTIEDKTIWKFNSRKTKIYELSKEDAVMTGLRLVRNRKTRKELKIMTEHRIKGARHCLVAWKPWYYLKPTIPKNTQRKIRSCIHKACLDVENTDAKLQRQTKGYISYVFHVYETYGDIPLQIRNKLDEYCNKKDKFLFVKFFNKNKLEAKP